MPRWRSRIHRNTGAPRIAVTMPIGSSAGATTSRADRVGQKQQAGAEERGVGQEVAVVRPGGEPQQMRHHDADKADPARHRDRRAGGAGDGEDGEGLQPLDRDAQDGRLRPRPAPARSVRGPGTARRRARDDDRPGGPELGPAGAGQRAERPERQVAQLAVVGDEDQRFLSPPGPARPARSRPAASSRSRSGRAGWRCGRAAASSPSRRGRPRPRPGGCRPRT